MQIYNKIAYQMANQNKEKTAARWDKVKIKHLDLPAELIKQIAQDERCTVETVRLALVLTNPRQGELADRIRYNAVHKYGAVEMVKNRWIRI